MDSYQDYFLPTLISILAIALKLLVNRKLNKKDLLTCIIETPKDIHLLSMGFIASFTAMSTDENNTTLGTIIILCSFILSIFIYALSNYSLDKYTGMANSKENDKLKMYLPLVFSVMLAWLLAIMFYYFSVVISLGGKTL